jgi:glyceraldehyde-3-phosphate dehydrogenase/erythrose-4-phosphate dehydrogenase
VDVVAHRGRSTLVDRRPAVDGGAGGTLLLVAAWYDNEMGFSMSLAKTAAQIAG